jgi:hypothetical protein
MNIPLGLKEDHIRFKRRLPLNQQAALNQYINSSSYLNTLLRDGLDVYNKTHCQDMPKNITQAIINMDDVFANKELQRMNKSNLQPFYVYRGINASASLGEMLETRGWITNVHFMSTSILPSVARNAFAGTECCVFKIIVDKNCDANYMYISNGDTSESEVLFERNIVLNYVSTNIETGKLVYTVRPSKRKPSSCSISPRASNNNNNSPRGPNLINITRDDIEDELMIMDEEDTRDVDALADSITQSLVLSYPKSNARDIKFQVVAHLHDMYGVQSGGGRRKMAAPQKQKQSRMLRSKC